jgi:hypothetical protein
MPIVRIEEPGSEKATGNPEMSAPIIISTSRIRK